MITPVVNWDPSTHVVSDFLDWSNSGRLELQPDFQRKEVWSKSAKIMLIDTILRNIPMPKVFLQTELRGQEPYRIVIDGQQRLTAILGFIRGEFGLESPYEGEFYGMKYQDIPYEAQRKVLRYRIDVNEIYDATPEMIRDIYSRVNKYTVQLNKQELRRADFPGDFLRLSEELAQEAFFDDNRVFTIASSKRMGDVEFVSELLALLLDGPQEKKENLDSFYSSYTKWPKDSMEKIQDRFKSVLNEMQTIWNDTEALGHLNPFAKSRFRQKADFYALFDAIDDLLRNGGSLVGKDLGPLRDDLAILDEQIEPESEIQLFRKYAIQCVSQSNTIGSRRWRRNVLRAFLAGTYIGTFPTGEIARVFHNTLIEAGLPSKSSTCPICGISHLREEAGSAMTLIAWERDNTVFQLSNAALLHKSCLSDNAAKSYRLSEPYETGDLDDSDFRTEK